MWSNQPCRVLVQKLETGGWPRVLVLSPVAEHPSPESVKRLEHAYSFKEELDPAWAARPIDLARHRDRIVLVLEDPGGKPLDQIGDFGETRPTGPSARAPVARFP
jgi:hypothetical protein